ncbi:hypothetical protein [Streptomyces eurythermus]|uniref:hypothetical protein n=1 Tax=Streptomyces eurythermus TaxID=42237 RepID=UPI0036FAAFEB
MPYGGGHVGLYIGDGQIIHAPKPGTTITTAPSPPPATSLPTAAYGHERRERFKKPYG